MRLFDSIARHHTKFQGKIRIRRKIIMSIKWKDTFSSFLTYDSQIALQSATQNFKFNLEFSEYRLERVSSPQTDTMTGAIYFRQLSNKSQF